LSLYGGILADHWVVGVATSGAAPARPLAKVLAQLMARASGWLGVRTVSFRRGKVPITASDYSRERTRAIQLGQRLVQDVAMGRRISPLKSQWIALLRKRLLPRFVEQNPDDFAAILNMWNEKDLD